jgi:FkbM family methyltransferase
LIQQTKERLNRPRPRTAKHGLGRGYRQLGGIGMALPVWVQRRREEDPEHTEREEALLRGLELEGGTVFDVGAFHGVTTLFFAGKVGPGGQVIAFEPHPANHDWLLTNLQLNDLTNVDARNAAVGAREGELVLWGNEGRASGSESIAEVGGGEDERITVPLHSIDAQTEAGLPDPDFVKIDVEGLELDVLEGMAATIERSHPRLFVEMHGADEAAKRSNAERVVALLVGHGYELRHVQSGTPVDATHPERAATGHLYCEWRGAQ